MSSVDIFIDPGHYQYRGRNLDMGVRSGDAIEAEQALFLSLTLKDVLVRDYGLTIELSRTGIEAPPYHQRIARAIARQAKIYFSVHFDIPNPGWRWGCYYGNSRSREAAVLVASALDGVNGEWGVWTKHHSESWLGRLFIAAFPGISLLAEFGPIRYVERDERIRIARAVAPALHKIVVKSRR
jgi:N-acetylmuramoyl-L-alanine amidase